MVISIKVESFAKRADLFLSEKLGITRSRIQNLIEKGFILLNSNPFKPSSRLKMGDLITGNIPEEEEESELKPINFPLDIIYEDESIIVINKPKGIVVHPSFGHKEDTIVNALLYHCKDLLNIGGTKRPGVVHRLDKDTSGILLFAKNEHALYNLQKQFKNRAVTKKYLALLLGKPEKDRDTIITNIGRHPKDRKKFAVTKEGRPAITEYNILKFLLGVSLAEITIKTGRTHQIRVHMSYINAPIIGDMDYNKKNYENIIKDKNLLQLCKEIKGQALCAHFLSFKHPITNKIMNFKVSPPKEMQKIIDWMKDYGANKET
ncbi:MAG: RluA family pseudouridine synthase [Proteobacteria bacterium]|nr:RluA family pseudouridine synthase [Pseudomonadota bacterium]